MASEKGPRPVAERGLGVEKGGETSVTRETGLERVRAGAGEPTPAFAQVSAMLSSQKHQCTMLHALRSPIGKTTLVMDAVNVVFTPDAPEAVVA